MLHAFVADIRSALPQKIQEAIQRPIRIRFKDLDGMELGDVCPVKEKGAKRHIFGYLSPWLMGDHEIRIHQGFKSEILKGPAGSRAIGCGHKSLYRLALGTVLHEIGHVVDGPDQRFSGAKQYLNLTDWPSRSFPSSSKNTLSVRSPDPYEFQSPAEGFAVNLEYFLLDPEFACRRPAVWRYLSGRFGAQSSNADCAPFHKVFLHPHGPWVDLNFSRVTQIDYLFAAEGKEVMSRWGHAMYRLVLCDEDRTAAGPECRSDTSRHVVVAYRANVLDAKISYLKGLKGDYPSRIYFHGFPEIIHEYTELELRDLISLPLALSPEQRELFIGRVLEQQWTYSGRYYFLSNNCATEASDALRSVVDSGDAFQDSPSISPSGVYADLAQAGLIDTSLLGSRDEAIRNGYLYPSHRAHLELAFAKLRQRLSPEGDFSYESLGRFLADSRSAERARYLRPQEPAHVAALYLLEQHLGQSLTKKVAKAAFAQTLRDESLKETSSQRFDAIRQQLENLKPWNQIEGAGYGIPQEGEVVLDRISRIGQALAEAIREAVKALEAAMPALFSELRASQENLKRFGKALWPEHPALTEQTESTPSS